MKKSCRDITKRINLSGWDNPQTDVLQLLKDWFESEESGNWLVVVDNADDVELLYSTSDGLAAYFPRSDRGSILMTTRNRQVGVKFATTRNVISLPALSDDEASILLTARLGDKQSEDQDLGRLADALERVPLALVQAASYISENETTISRYLTLYHASDASKIHLLSQDFEDDVRDPELKNPVAAAWMVSFEYIKKYCPQAADFLCMMCMFDAQNIPESLLSRNIKDATEALLMEQALGLLQAYSMISQRHSGTMARDHQVRSYDLHRLVRLVTRNWLAMHATFDHWTAEAFELISLRCMDSGKSPEAASRYMPHAMVILSTHQLQLQNDAVFVPTIFYDLELQGEHSEQGVICPTCTANLLNTIFTTHFENGDMKMALLYVRKATVIFEYSLGQNHTATLRCRYNEAVTSDNLGHSACSEQLFREVLATNIEIHGRLHKDSLKSLAGLATNYKNTGRLLEAERLFVEGLDLSKQIYGENHRDTLKFMQSFG